MKKGCLYGTHRVLEPKGVLPQPALKIDNDMEIYDNEILIDVKTLNIDSASFTQVKEQAGGDKEKMAEIIMGIVAERGKMQNPVTGSGGMLIGTVEKIGENCETDLKVGDKIATLVSLSLTPLKIDEILEVKDNDQVNIKGKAILFQSGIYAKIPEDMHENLVLSALDIAGAPAQTAKLVRPGDTVVLIGGTGKAGMFCLYEAKKRAGVTGKVITVDINQDALDRVMNAGLADIAIKANAQDAVEMMEKIGEVTDGQMADVVINIVNVPNTEMSTILITKDEGTAYFFSMATSFTKAALGAEGVGKDIEMVMGNGYTKGHAEITLQILRESKELRDICEQLYV